MENNKKIEHESDQDLEHENFFSFSGTVSFINGDRDVAKESILRLISVIREDTEELKKAIEKVSDIESNIRFCKGGFENILKHTGWKLPLTITHGEKIYILSTNFDIKEITNII